MTGRCSFTALQTFIQTAIGLQTTGQSQLMQVQQEANVVINGSFIVLTCISGYNNIGGSLNVTCLSNGMWSSFPNCVLNNSNGSSITTTTMSTNNGAPCAVDATTFTINYGYYSNISLIYVSSSTVTGNK